MTFKVLNGLKFGKIIKKVALYTNIEKNVHHQFRLSGSLNLFVLIGRAVAMGRAGGRGGVGWRAPQAWHTREKITKTNVSERWPFTGILTCLTCSSTS